MTQSQKKRLSWTAALSLLAVVVVVVPPVRGLGMRLLDIPSNDSVERIVGDSLRQHVESDRTWHESTDAQLEAIRCSVDTTYQRVYYARCNYRVRVTP